MIYVNYIIGGFFFVAFSEIMENSGFKIVDLQTIIYFFVHNLKAYAKMVYVMF